MNIQIPVNIELVIDQFDEKSMAYLDACFYGDVAKVREIIKSTPNIVKELSLGIEYACQENHIDVVRCLVGEGNMNIKKEGKNAIIVSAYYGRTELVKMLIALGADVSTSNHAALILSCKYGHKEIVEFLITNYGDTTPDLNIYLMSACLSGDFETIKFLINMGCDPLSFNHMVIRMCCENGDVQVLEYLKNMGVSFSDSIGQMLCIACKFEHIEIIKFLVENGANVHENKNSPLVSCLMYDRKLALEFLVDHIKRTENFDISEILRYAKKLKKDGSCDPSSCISYLRGILGEEDDFPSDLIIENEECPVCEERSELILPCRHIICKRCYYHLVEKNCPICRYKIDENLIKKRVH